MQLQELQFFSLNYIVPYQIGIVSLKLITVNYLDSIFYQ